MVNAISTRALHNGTRNITSGYLPNNDPVSESAQSTRNSKDKSDLAAVYERHQDAQHRNSYKHIYKHPLLDSNHSGSRYNDDYKDWTKELKEESGALLERIREEMLERDNEVADEDLVRIGQEMDTWLQGLQMRLEQLLEQASPKVKDKLLEQATRLINKTREHLQAKIQKIIDRINQGEDPEEPEDPIDPPPIDPPPVDPPLVDPPPVDPPPVDPPPVNPPPVTNPLPPVNPTSVFTRDRVTIDIGSGTNKSAIVLQNPIAANRSSTLFYVVDARGNRMAVSIKFGNSSLEQEFANRFKKSKMYGETISLEKFNRFLDRFKSYMNSISGINIDRLKSKVSGDRESTKLDAVIQQFDKFLLQLK